MSQNTIPAGLTSLHRVRDHRTTIFYCENQSMGILPQTTTLQKGKRGSLKVGKNHNKTLERSKMVLTFHFYFKGIKYQNQRVPQKHTKREK